MNEMDLLSRLREEVPLGVSPGAEQLFRAALIESDNPGGEAVPSLPSGGPRAGRRGLRVAWRPVLAVPLALGVAAAVVVAVLPSHGHGPGPGAARDPAGQWPAAGPRLISRRLVGRRDPCAAGGPRGRVRALRAGRAAGPVGLPAERNISKRRQGREGELRGTLVHRRR